MKLLNRQTRVNTEDPLGRGLDAVVVLVLFFGAGFGLDRLFGTTPVFMIAFTLLGGVGLFIKFKYSYDARMEQHEAERRARLGRAQAPAQPAVGRDEAA